MAANIKLELDENRKFNSMTADMTWLTSAISHRTGSARRRSAGLCP